jgi:hypothetical protein
LAPVRGYRLPAGVLVLLGRARSARWRPPEKQWNAAPRQDSIHTPSPARAVGSEDWPRRLLRQTRFRAAAWRAAPETGGMSATRCDDTLQLALVDLWLAGSGAKRRLLVDTMVWHTPSSPVLGSPTRPKFRSLRCCSTNRWSSRRISLAAFHMGKRDSWCCL